MDWGRPTTTTTIIQTTLLRTSNRHPHNLTHQPNRLALRQVLELHEPQYLEELRAKRTELAVGFCHFPEARLSDGLI